MKARRWWVNNGAYQPFAADGFQVAIVIVADVVYAIPVSISGYPGIGRDKSFTIDYRK